MTDTTTAPEPDDDTGDVSVRVTLYPEEAPEKAIRQLGYGITPFVLLEADVDDDDNVTFEFIGSHIDTMEELLELLEGYTEALRDAIAQSAAAQA